MKAQSQFASVTEQKPLKRYTLEEYFDLEYKAERKHEFWDGEIRAMSYASPEHGKIQTNLMDAFAVCLKAKGCARYTSDRMILVPECNKVFYPDILIVCEEEIFHIHKKKMKISVNPTVVIEILSDSTAEIDRTKKLTCYRSISSLQQYLIVEQNMPNIHSYRRRTEREWDYTYADKPDDTIAILDCVVKIEAVYAGIAIP